MSRILLDGEGVYRASMAIKAIKDKKWNADDYDSLLNVITAILLWDDVYYFSDGFGSYDIRRMRYFAHDAPNFHRIDPHCALPKELEKMELEHFFEMCKTDTEELKRNEDGRFSPEAINTMFGNDLYYNISVDGKRALDYLLVANINGLDYMPSIHRQKILESYNYSDFFVRKDVIAKLDKELNQYYTYVNEQLVVKRIHYSFPVLLDYLLDGYSCEDIIKRTFALKQTSPLEEFRKEMDQLDKAWKNGDIKSIEKYFKEIEHIVGKISGIIKCEKKIDVTVTLSPTLSFGIPVPLPHKKIIHSVFLKDLAFYGITKRSPKPELDSRLWFHQL